jgi:secondary thiamine-phosphate synthase enzyme
MRSHTEYRTFNTKKQQEIIHITPWVEDEVAKSGIQEGFCLVSAMHITASVFINDNESGLHQDIYDWLEGAVAPWASHPARGDDYLHNRTGEDNGAAHLRNLTIGHEVIIPVTDGRLDLGPWQAVFYGEWDGRRSKRIVLKVIGE